MHIGGNLLVCYFFNNFIALLFCGIIQEQSEDVIGGSFFRRFIYRQTESFVFFKWLTDMIILDAIFRSGKQPDKSLLLFKNVVSGSIEIRFI